MPLVLFWACDDKLETNDYRYPLDIGNKWIYLWKVNMFEGSSVDFNEELIGSSFKISNPKTKSSCGCGISFSF